MSGILGSKLTNTEHKYARVLYYGNGGTGKSTHIATMANRGLTVVIDMEEGYEEDALRERGVNVDNLLVFSPRSYAELEQCYWEIKGMIDGGEPVYGVAVDHWSEIQDILVRHAAMQRIEKKRHELTKLAVASADAKAELAALSVFRTDLPDYGMWTEQGKVLLRNFRDLQCHVAFASHETVDENSAKIVPLQTDKFRAKLQAGVRTVVYTKSVEIKAEGRMEFLGVTKPVDRFASCKDRTGKLPTVMVNPTMERIIDVLSGDLDLATDSAQLAYANRKTGK